MGTGLLWGFGSLSYGYRSLLWQRFCGRQVPRVPAALVALTGTVHGVLQCVAVCCSVLQCVAVCCSALHCVAVCCSVLQCVAVRCSALQCVAVCCNALQCVAVHCSALQCVAVRCSALQCVAVRCSAFKRVAGCCRVLQSRIYECYIKRQCIWIIVHNANEYESYATFAQHFFRNPDFGCGVDLWDCFRIIQCYGVATISRLLKIIGLFSRISSLL